MVYLSLFGFICIDYFSKPTRFSWDFHGGNIMMYLWFDGGTKTGGITKKRVSRDWTSRLLEAAPLVVMATSYNPDHRGYTAGFSTLELISSTSWGYGFSCFFSIHLTIHWAMAAMGGWRGIEWHEYFMPNWRRESWSHVL